MPNGTVSKRDPCHDILYEPVRTGPVTAKNRLFQVEHCNCGYRDPLAVVGMRRIEADGGWGVIFTEQIDLPPTSEIAPFIELRLWEDQAIPVLARMAEAMNQEATRAAAKRGYAVARHNLAPIRVAEEMPVFTPDDLTAGKLPEGGEVVLHDDDHCYMGGVLAELLVKKGLRVTLVTPANLVSEWTLKTLEQYRTRDLTCDAVVLVTARLTNDALWQELKSCESEWAAAGIRSIQRIGDADAPAPIAWATYAGHRFAREQDTMPEVGAIPFRREVTELAPME